jgi:hypothetical protein
MRLAPLLMIVAVALSLPAPPAAAQQAQRVCTPLIHVVGLARVGERRAMEAAVEAFDTRLASQFGPRHPYVTAAALRDRTLQATCQRDGARQFCTMTGTLCVLSRAAPACHGPQRIDADGIYDTCTVNLSTGGGFRQPTVSGTGSFPTQRIPCPRGYEVRVRAGQDTCMLPGY